MLCVRNKRNKRHAAHGHDQRSIRYFTERRYDDPSIADNVPIPCAIHSNYSSAIRRRRMLGGSTAVSYSQDGDCGRASGFRQIV